LTLVRKYRFWTAGLLLALYAFIAMPVQVWHTHSGNANSSATQCDNKEASHFSHITHGSSLSHDCKICAHQYTVYSNDQCQVLLASLPIQKPVEQFSITALLQTAHCPFSNKGPPVVA
jgi:hypothetical protein